MKKNVQRILGGILVIVLVFATPTNAKAKSNNPNLNTKILGEYLECGTTRIDVKEKSNNAELISIQPKAKKQNVTYCRAELFGTLDCLQVRFSAIASDPVEKIVVEAKVYDSKGKYRGSHKFTAYNLLGQVVKTWNHSVRYTVQEKVVLSGYFIQNGKRATLHFSNKAPYRYNFNGGAYNKLKALDGQRHHMPCQKALKDTKFTYKRPVVKTNPKTKKKEVKYEELTPYYGPCITMVTAEHQKTLSWGSRGKSHQVLQKRLLDDGKFLNAQKLDINDVQRQFGTKYNSAINEMLAYTKTLKLKK